MKAVSTILLMIFVATPGAWAKTSSKKANRSARSANVAASTQAKDINMSQSFDSLGTDEEIIEKARALQPNNTMRIVQKREVDRTWRPEFGLNYGIINGGDSYIETNSVGANVDLHINPHWSVGVRYQKNFNRLTKEGENIFNIADAKQAAGDTSFVRPGVDYPKSSYMAVVNWYPIYGKISWLEYGVSQFDFYLLGGGGQVQLNSGNAPIYTGGLGMGLWWNKWFTTRLEARYQGYQDQPVPGDKRQIDTFIVNFGLGIML